MMKQVLQGTEFEGMMDHIDHQTHQEFLMKRTMELASSIKDQICRGCGCNLQFADDTKEGFIDMNQFLEKNDESRREEITEEEFVGFQIEEEGEEEGYFTVEDYLQEEERQLPTLDQLKRLIAKKKKGKACCERCQILNTNDFDRLKRIEVEIDSKFSKKSIIQLSQIYYFDQNYSKLIFSSFVLFLARFYYKIVSMLTLCG